MDDRDETPTILIVEANAPATNSLIRANGNRPYAEIFRTLLQRRCPSASITIVDPGEGSALRLLERFDLRGIDGVAWTGSSLNAYGADALIRTQVELFNRLFEACIPIYGSCWGLQLMTISLGGTVRRNPWGREIGVARDIILTDLGRGHPMFAGKASRFDALCTHTDEVASLPEGCVLLASNAASAVQAACLEVDDRSFWGVQYHPEFDLPDVIGVLERASASLVEEGFFASPGHLDGYCRSLAEIGRSPETTGMQRSFHGISDDVVHRGFHELEIANWLSARVLPRFEARRAVLRHAADPG